MSDSKNKNTKLHEILAVENGVAKTSKKLVLESKKVFDKEHLFSGSLRSLDMFDSNESHLNTTDFVQLETTVDENLDYSLNAVAQYWDAVVQKDVANQNANADVVYNGKIILENIPSTTLLGLESKLSELRNLLESIPTLPPGIVWEDAEGEKKGVFKAKDSFTQFKTEKDIDFRVLYEATKEHPAQIKEFNVTKNVGKYTTTKWSGMVTPYKKAELLTNLENLISSIKKARQRANNTIVEDKHIGKDLINFIMSK